MKAKLTVTIDEELIPKAKEHARAQGMSLSQLIENSLRELAANKRTPFGQRWRGKLSEAERDDERYKALKKRYQ